MRCLLFSSLTISGSRVGTVKSEKLEGSDHEFRHAEPRNNPP